MKLIFKIALVLVVSITSLNAQTDMPVAKEGDIYLIAETINDNYLYIKVPKDNFIVKRGGIRDYKSFAGKKVVLSKIKKNNKGETVATIKLASGKRFFKSHKYLKVLLPQAISEGELVKA